MDVELRRYMLRSSSLPDSPPGIHPDTSLSDVCWTNDDLELSRVNGDMKALQLVNARELKAAICISPKKMTSCDFYLFVMFSYLFARFS